MTQGLFKPLHTRSSMRTGGGVWVMKSLFQSLYTVSFILLDSQVQSWGGGAA